MKKIIYSLIVVILAGLCVFYVGENHKLKQGYELAIENLESEKAGLEKNIYNCMLGDGYVIRFNYGDKVYHWTCKSKGLFESINNTVEY